ncbi:MAG: NAD-glutamate dehydrogenase [Thermoanaerobaculia bacterium]|nr:NAD-glutamate dehydrogenase [Thermoanaerobaculia bacterium]
MEITGTSLRRELLEELAHQVRVRAPEGEKDRVGELARRSFEHLPPEEILDASLENEAGGMVSLWRLGRERSPGTLKLKVSNPRVEEEGWSSPHTVIQLVNDDMPFLLASIMGELHRRKVRVHRVLHPVVGVRRSPTGEVETLGEEGPLRESWMQIEIDRVSRGSRGREELEGELREVLGEVRVVVDDWRPMEDRVRKVLEELETTKPPVSGEEEREARAFLEWLLDDHFTFLGFRSYELDRRDEELYLRPVSDSGLGLLREISDDSRARARESLPDSLAAFFQRQETLYITKSRRRARVHRRVHMDIVGIRRFDESGGVVGEHRFVGLFTSAVYTARANNVPILRRKVDRILEWADFTPGSHDAKALRHVLENFPRDELFQIREEDLFRIAMGILRLQQQHRVALFVRRDEFERFVSCLVYVPRERYTFELRRRMQELLETAFDGEVTAFYTQMSDAPLARTHYIVRTEPGEIPHYDLRQVEDSLAQAARTWTEHLREHLVRAEGEEVGLALVRKYGDAFPVSYRERFPAKAAIPDIRTMQVLLGSREQFDACLYRPPDLGEDRLRLKLYRVGRHLSLSDALPVLENLGLRVESEVPFETRFGDGDGTVWIHDFELRSLDGSEIPFDTVREPLEETVRRVWEGRLASGILNRLVLVSGMEWHQVVVLRAYSRYLRQIGVTFSQVYMAQTLVRNPNLARALFHLFSALFDPDHREDFRSRAASALADVRAGLEKVESLDEDRILRRFLSVIRATLRTNYFQRTGEGRRKRYLSFKLDGRKIRDLPEPRPMFEIFVYSPRTEGVHLRGGKVARGGIRWSDRREDFRTEILGLVKAQMVKNAVIVPVGAKGGFVVKRPPPDGDREALLEEGVECYKILVRGLLDLTDNRVEGEVVPPPDLVRRDDDDPYLVVAADKGTATFSDIANAVAAEYGFWLGDAFASGGSAGYDHKRMGITARGAWEAVKRHFRELGKDVQKEEFTVVGVGDMSGDVFGNGMLLSRHTRLVGAFNHRHVFVDPDPDPEESYEERQRLFRLSRSSWTDYDSEAISEGGGVFDRSAKWIPVSPEMEARFGIRQGRTTPDELIRALLRAAVDLLWLGGIGTFVKSSEERHGDVGDRANDGVRVDAADLQASVVGEGANLGFTQPARVEFALARGKINNDAIDNSGGVDCSDHEVNIKIALGPVVRGGGLTIRERNELLDAMTEEVAGLVLRDNYLQTQAISLAEHRGVELLDPQARMIRSLEREGKLNRALEHLPEEEILRERVARGRGLNRPELAVLLAFSKISLYEELLASDLPDDPLLTSDLLRYFPRPLADRYPEAVKDHDLRREIVATYVTNSTVNRVGPSFVYRLGEASGREARDVARAYTITRDSLDLREIWTAVEELDNEISAGLQLDMLEEVARLTERVTLWFLRRFEGPLKVSEIVTRYRGPLRRLAEGLEPLLPGLARRDLEQRAGELESGGVPATLARRVAGLRGLTAGVDIVRLVLEAEADVERVARIYFGLGEQFGFAWLRTKARTVEVESAWEQSALEALLDDLYRYQTEMARQVLDASEGHDPWETAIEAWAGSRPNAAAQARKVMEEIRAEKGFEISMLTVIEHRLKGLVER